MLRLFLFLLLVFPDFVEAKEVYQEPIDFINEAFKGTPPDVETLWVDDSIRGQVDKIMGHNYPVVRIKYWSKEKRSAWILEEIGKVKPITAGFVVNNGEIEFLKVLIYRESHGWEVKYPFFTDQFKQTKLIDNKKLSQSIDNISGATMSVDALRNMTKLALFLHATISSE